MASQAGGRARAGRKERNAIDGLVAGAWAAVINARSERRGGPKSDLVDGWRGFIPRKGPRGV